MPTSLVVAHRSEMVRMDERDKVLATRIVEKDFFNFAALKF